MALTEINPGMWTPEKDGDSIRGILLRSESDVGKNQSMMYHLEVDGKPLSVWGSAILDQRMAWIKEGETVVITYKGLGEATGGHNPPKIFKVEVDDLKD